MSSDWKRIGVMIGLLLLFGSIFAEATNYIIINRGTDLNLSNISFNYSGTIPASNITAGTFGSNIGNGNYTFPEYLEVQKHINITGNESNSTFYGDITVIGKIYGGSPVKIAGGLNVTTGDSWFGNITVEKCIGCEIINGTNINADNISAQNLYVNQSINLPNNSIIDAYINSMNANKLFNISALDYQILISQNNITGGLIIPYANITGLPNVTAYNESGIARNYSMTGTGTGSLPDWNIIYIDGVIKPMTNGSLVFLFNNDTTPSYLYRRVQGLTFLYQAVTVNPQQNITLEHYSSDKERTISIIIKRTPTQILGEFYITSYYNSTYAPYKTMGSFSYKNSTNVNTFSISPMLSADSYLIVKSETL